MHTIRNFLKKEDQESVRAKAPPGPYVAMPLGNTYAFIEDCYEFVMSLVDILNIEDKNDN